MVQGQHFCQRSAFNRLLQLCNTSAERRPQYLFDLSGQHAALYAQHGGDVHVFSAHVVHPLCKAVHRGLEQHPRELDDVQHALDDVVC